MAKSNRGTGPKDRRCDGEIESTRSARLLDTGGDRNRVQLLYRQRPAHENGPRGPQTTETEVTSPPPLRTELTTSVNNPRTFDPRGHVSGRRLAFLPPFAPRATAEVGAPLERDRVASKSPHTLDYVV